MRVRVSEPRLLPDLLEFLAARCYAVASQVGDDAIEVSLLGSFAPEAMRMLLYLLVRAWETGRRVGSVVEIVQALEQARPQRHLL
jgi:hypothetical protein